MVESFRHAWRGYKDHAWGHDNLKPVSGMAFDWFSLGLTIVDSLDTAYIMGLTEGKVKKSIKRSNILQADFILCRHTWLTFYHV